MKRFCRFPHKPTKQSWSETTVWFAVLLFFIIISAANIAARPDVTYASAGLNGLKAGTGLVNLQVLDAVTPTPGATESPGEGKTQTVTPPGTISPTQTETIRPIATTTQTVSATFTARPTANRTPTASPGWVTPIATQAATASPTLTASPTASPSASPTPTATPPPTATSSPTLTATEAPTMTPTLPPAAAVLESPIPEGIATPSGKPLPSGATTTLRVGLLLIFVAAVIIVGVVWILLRRHQPKPKLKPEPPPPVPPSPPPATYGLFTPVRPQPGVPYLESKNRPAGVLYGPLTQPRLAIGREPGNDFVVDTSFQGWQTVSHRHAILERNGERVVIIDQGSRNGTYVNNRRTGANVLQDGWLVKLGQVEFVFRSNQGGGAS